jgi:hypothetical protein
MIVADDLFAEADGGKLGRFSAAGFGPVLPNFHALTRPSPSPQRCCNVRGQYSQFNGGAAKRISFQRAISQFNGNIDLIDLSRNRCLIPKGNMTMSASAVCS